MNSIGDMELGWKHMISTEWDSSLPLSVTGDQYATEARVAALERAIATLRTTCHSQADKIAALDKQLNEHLKAFPEAGNLKAGSINCVRDLENKLYNISLSPRSEPTPSSQTHKSNHSVDSMLFDDFSEESCETDSPAQQPYNLPGELLVFEPDVGGSLKDVTKTTGLKPLHHVR
jgi:hypothetical protein